MSFDDTTRALMEYEDALWRHGAAVTRRLHAGLTRQRAEWVAQSHGVFLTEDALALWMWHDGDAEASSCANGWSGKPGIAAWLSFPCLDDAMGIAREGASDSRLRPVQDTGERFFHLPVAIHGRDQMIGMECREGAVDSRGYYGSVGDSGNPGLPFSQMVRSWIAYVESGYWMVYPDGELRTEQRWGLPGCVGSQRTREIAELMYAESVRGAAPTLRVWRMGSCDGIR